MSDMWFKRKLNMSSHEGVEQNQIESADIDICITVCIYCHRMIHTLPGCTYWDLRCNTRKKL